MTKVLDFLNEYTKTHFGHEEILQRESGYPDYPNHEKYHTGFIKMVADMSERVKKEGPSVELVGEINRKLGDWLLNHIKKQDVKVAAHIRSVQEQMGE